MYWKQLGLGLFAAAVYSSFSFLSLADRAPLIPEPFLSIIMIGGIAALPVHFILRLFVQRAGWTIEDNGVIQFALAATLVWGVAVFTTLIVWLIAINVFGTN